MRLLLNAVRNFFRLLRNLYVRARRRPPDFVWLPINGSLPELDPPGPGLLRRRLAPRPEPPPSLESIRSRLDRLLPEERVRGVVLRIENLDAGWASLEELRLELARFRETGKRVVAYLVDGGDTRAYYLATAADEVFATPLATLDVTGLRSRVNFLKDSLERLGLRAEVLAVSPYKSAGDTISRTDFTKESREQAERLLDRRFEKLVGAISDGRSVSRERVREIIDGAPYPAPEAVREGLLDGALYEDEVASRLGDNEKAARLAEWGEAKKALPVSYSRRIREVVGLVRVEGTVSRGRSRKLPVPLPLLGSEQAGSDSVVAALRVAEKSRGVGAVLLHVDSRGGDALASDLMWREVERLRQKKPVVVLMGNAAASGGYYVSAPASCIVARENTITGSIGVILTRPVASGLLAKYDVHPVALERGARSNLLDPRQPPSADELVVLNEQLQHFYGGFKERVEKGRGIQPNDLEEIAGGRVWTGAEARELGLVDETGGFRQALARARELAGIPDEGPDALVKISPPRNARPTPGEPIREAVDALRGAVGELTGQARVWAHAPYDLSDGW